MDTSAYGQLWPQLTHDHRLMYGKVNIDSMSKVMTLLQDRLRLHPVDLIGKTKQCITQVVSDNLLITNNTYIF